MHDLLFVGQPQSQIIFDAEVQFVAMVIDIIACVQWWFSQGTKPCPFLDHLAVHHGFTTHRSSFTKTTETWDMHFSMNRKLVSFFWSNYFYCHFSKFVHTK